MKPTKFLIIDSEPITRSFIRGIILDSMPKSDVEEVPNLKQGKLKFEQDRFGMVLLSWDMPDSDEDEILAWMKEAAATKKCPILMVTSKEAKEYVVKAIQNGAAGYMIKPFTHGKLVATIKDAIQKHRKLSKPQIKTAGNAAADAKSTIDFQARLHIGENTLNSHQVMDINGGGVIITVASKKFTAPVLTPVKIDILNKERCEIEKLQGFVYLIQAVEDRPQSEFVKVALRVTDADKEKRALLTNLARSVKA